MIFQSVNASTIVNPMCVKRCLLFIKKAPFLLLENRLDWSEKYISGQEVKVQTTELYKQTQIQSYAFTSQNEWISVGPLLSVRRQSAESGGKLEVLESGSYGSASTAFIISQWFQPCLSSDSFITCGTLPGSKFHSITNRWVSAHNLYLNYRSLSYIAGKFDQIRKFLTMLNHSNALEGHVLVPQGPRLSIGFYATRWRPGLETCLVHWALGCEHWTAKCFDFRDTLDLWWTGRFACW